MYMSKKKFDEIKAKHSTTIVVDADVGEADAIKTASRTQLHLSDA